MSPDPIFKNRVWRNIKNLTELASLYRGSQKDVLTHVKICITRSMLSGLSVEAELVVNQKTDRKELNDTKQANQLNL
ncbi:hypothetical protein NHQ30_000864 [Ciborinia camelliae]|nr:hypothetical protein NHQ30_000864 [Ciborinia camelliae]